MARHRARYLVGLLLLFFVLALITPTVKAWEQGDFEIFDLVDELEKFEGSEIDFYTYMDISPSAPLQDVNRAYKKKSLEMHPDKNKRDPKAKERFARLGKITALLRDPERRERYNFFYKNGVPRWRGTGYLYRRYRPGFGAAIAFILLVSGILHYVAMYISYIRDRSKIRLWVQDGRAALAKSTPKSQGPPTRGKTYIELNDSPMKVDVIGDGHIIFYPPDGDQIEMNEEWLHKPNIQSVFLIAWMPALIRKLTNKNEIEEGAVEEIEKEEKSGELKQKEEKEGSVNEKKAKNSPRPTMVAGSRRRNVRK